MNPLLHQYRQKNQRFARLISRLQEQSDDQDFWNTAEALHREGRLSELDVTDWEKKVRTCRSDPVARWYLAEALAAAGAYGDALQAWRKVLVLKPDAAPAALRLAQMSFRDGAPDEAVRWLKRICNRLPDNARLKTSVLGLCLSEGFHREARALAELFLDQGRMGPDSAETLFHLFRLFDDRSRACQSAGLHARALPRDPQGLWLAVRASMWAGDLQSSIEYLSALSEVAPGGNVLARKAVAEFDLGWQDKAAQTLASAAQLFIAEPAPLADLAVGLSRPRFEKLRQVVLSTLQRLAAADASATSALALAHYRIGNWRAAAEVLEAATTPKDWPELAVVSDNLQTHRQSYGELPVDAAAFAFENNLISPGRAEPPDAGESGTVLLVLGDDLAAGEREWMLQLLSEAGSSLTVVELGDQRSDADGGMQAALLSECFTGCERYVQGAAGQVVSVSEGGDFSGLGYLPPDLSAEVLWLRDEILKTSPHSVHVAGGGAAISAALGAIHAGVDKVRLHAGRNWLEAGMSRHQFFKRGVSALLSDRRLQLVTTTDEKGELFNRLFAPAKVPRPLIPGVDGKSIRDRSRLIHRLRAREALDVQAQPEDCMLVSVFGPGDPDHLKDLLGALRSQSIDRFRFVVWTTRNDRGLHHAFQDEQQVVLLPWPSNPGAFLVHCKLAITWACDDTDLQLLSHAAMSVPVLAVESSVSSMPLFGPVDRTSLAARLIEFLDCPGQLDDTAEKARLWVQSNRPMRRAVRQIRRLDGLPDS